ncbi:hypothetical protein niasHT_020786 [Heterodera trifolii]|uniref:phospholipase A2 n=1 Tax=Heterodera trifolii TaxID=157864 RepID=A0ABD2KEV9_9BILA
MALPYEIFGRIFAQHVQAADEIIDQSLFGRFNRQYLKNLFVMGIAELEARDALRHQTPLIHAVKRKDLDAVLNLLAFGADPNNADNEGNTPLHHAVKTDSLLIVKLLLCFGADLNVRNNSQKTPSDVPNIDEKSASVLSRAEVWSRGFNTSKLLKAKTKKRHDAALAKVTREQQRRAMANQRERRTAKDKGNGDALRLLSLDGGGIRGLVLIQILLELERLVDGGDTQKKGQRTKDNFIQRHFDWVAGTSTGAILALALADGTSLIDCLRLYLRLKDDVFGPDARESHFGGYKPECLEKFLQDHFGKQRKMSDIQCGKMKVFATATDASKIPVKLVLLRNYDSPFVASAEHANTGNCIWKAARCTSAAPTYFSNVGGLIDGGIYANNPSNELLKEVYLCNELAKLDNESDRPPNDSIAFLLSLGTGRMPPRKLENIDVAFQPTFSSFVRSIDALNNLKTIMVNQVTNSDGAPVELSRTICHDKKVPFFRITPQLKDEIKLDTTDNVKIVKMMWKAKAYVSDEICARANRYKYSTHTIIYCALNSFQMRLAQGGIRANNYVTTTVQLREPHTIRQPTSDCLRVEIYRDGESVAVGRKDILLNILTVEPPSSSVDGANFVEFSDAHAELNSTAQRCEAKLRTNFIHNLTGESGQQRRHQQRPSPWQLSTFYWLALAGLFACLLLPPTTPPPVTDAHRHGIALSVPHWLRPSHTQHCVAAYILGLLTMYFFLQIN